MADITVLQAQNWGSNYSETGGPTSRLSIAGASFTAGRQYLIIYRAHLGYSSTSSTQAYAYADLPDSGATRRTMGRVRAPGSTSYQMQVAWAEIVTADGSTPAEILSYEASSGTAYISDMSIVAIPLNDLSDGTDYGYTWDSDVGAHSTASWTDVVTKAFTGTSGDDLMVLGFVKNEVNDTSHQSEYRLTKDDAVMNAGTHSQEGRASDEEYGLLFLAYDEGVDGSSHTYALECNDETGTIANNYSRQALIFVLRLNKFESHHLDTGENTSPTAGANNVVVTGTYTPTNTGDQVILFYGLNDIAAVTNRWDIGLQVNGSWIPNYAYASVASSGDATDVVAAFGAAVTSVSSAGYVVRTYPWLSGANTLDFLNGVIVAFDTTLAAGGSPQTANLNAAARTRSAQSAAVTPGAVTGSLTAASRTRSPQVITVTPGAVSASLAAASRTRTAQTVTVTPGVVSVTLDAAVRTRSAQTAAFTASNTADLAAAARVRSAQASTLTASNTVALDAAVRNRAAQDAAVTPGAASVSLTAAVRTRSAQNTAATPGAVTVELDPAGRDRLAEDVDGAAGDVSASLAAAVRTRSAQNTAATPGAVTVDVDAGVRSRAAQAAAATPGTATVDLDAASRTRSAKAVTVTPGVVSAALDTAVRTRAAQDAAVTPGAASVSLAAGIRSRAAQDVTASAGLVANLDAGVRSRAAQAAAATPGAATVDLDAASRTRSAQDTTVNVGDLSTGLDPAFRSRAPLDVTVSVGAVAVNLNTAIRTRAAQDVAALSDSIALLEIAVRVRAGQDTAASLGPLTITLPAAARQRHAPDVWAQALYRHLDGAATAASRDGTAQATTEDGSLISVAHSGSLTVTRHSGTLQVDSEEGHGT